jgi:hypothetical protein
MLSMDDLFKGRHFDREIIILCVRWYLRFKLSFRDLVEMMAEAAGRCPSEGVGGPWGNPRPGDLSRICPLILFSV